MSAQADWRAQLSAARTRIQSEAARKKRASAGHRVTPAPTPEPRFADAVGAVQALRTRQRASLKPPPPAALALQRAHDEQAALAESLSDAFDAASLLETDEALSFQRPGIGRDVLAKLRRGQWRIQAELDLHGLRREAARDALAEFLRSAQAQGLRCVRVIHGKGLGSPGKTPVLKSRVPHWLAQRAQVQAFVQARAADGGAGALVVLLHGGRPATPVRKP